MYNYVHTAVARPLEHQNPRPIKDTSPERKVKLLTSGEKLLYLGSLVCCVFLALFVLKGRVQLTSANLEINKIENQLLNIKQKNIQLNIESKEANGYDNIQNFIAERKLVKISSRPLPPNNLALTTRSAGSR